MEEEEADEEEQKNVADPDAAFLSSLGVTAAKPEDIERHVIAEIEKANQERTREVGEESEGIFLFEEDKRCARESHIHAQLALVRKEIKAVQAGLESFEEAELKEDGPEDLQGVTTVEPIKKDHTDLHKTLAEERLKSLKQKKLQLKAQLKAAENGGNNDEFNNKGIKRSEGTVQFQLDNDDDFDAALDSAAALVETERERLIRTGALTPFDRVEGFERRIKIRDIDGSEDGNKDASLSKVVAAFADFSGSRPTTKLLDASELPRLEPSTREFRLLRKSSKGNSGDMDGKSYKHRKRKRPLPEPQWRIKAKGKQKESLEADDDWIVDDEDDLSSSSDDGKRQRKKENKEKNIGLGVCEEDDVLLEGGLKIPASIYSNLFDYQKTGVKWLWELHCQRAGGIIGDEMGLGKTIQIIAFLASLHHSGMYKPSIIVSPVTLVQQWKREAQKWYSAFKVEILHDSACRKSARKNSSSDSDENSQDIQEKVSPKDSKWNGLIDRITRSDSGLLITTYEQLRILKEKLLDIRWGYAVLDEGHRIRNPDTETTLVCKQLQTVHRIIMTGAPIQNKLTELWSLFDFVFPGKLGVLPVFQAQFALPIAIGGYANATPLQVSTAYRCAVVLRDLIMPYLLRRMKSDVEANLPKKTEHVLFCTLTEEQRSAYRAFIGSKEVEQIFDGSRNSLYGIDILRKICNHPDLLEREHSSNHPDYGNIERSAKLKVVAQVLELWKGQGHRVLIFAQTQQMLDILEGFIVSKEYVYRRMDGTTPISQRMALIDEFNESDHVFVFILTTKVGGLGTNLTGANRVIIFDPDWNPSTDMQARERAWRIGQLKDVTIYRLITRGTIEEKVYHRQIYKHFLTNRILRDPQQRRIFKARDMRDLFVLQDDQETAKTETSQLFAEVGDTLCRNGVTNTKKSNKGKGSKNTKVQHKMESNSTLEHENKGKEIIHTTLDEHQDESRILKTLFDANGIHSAMDHDAILSVNEPERIKIDYEASKVAQRAAEALKQSRMLRANESVSVPTWTGRSGEAGAPTSKRRFGSTVNSQLFSSISEASRPAAGAGAGQVLSSSDLLSKMRERRAGADIATNLLNNGTGGSHGQASRLAEALVKQLRSFMLEHGGTVSSAHVVEHFKSRISSSELPLFRQLLKQIATLNRSGAIEPMWVLNPDYQDKPTVSS